MPIVSCLGNESRTFLAITGSSQHTPLLTSRITSANFDGSISLRQYAIAPEERAAITSSSLSCEVKAITLISLFISFTFTVASIPFMPASPKSIRTMSGVYCSINFKPSNALSLSATTLISSLELSAHRKPTRVSLKSSIMITLIVFFSALTAVLIINPPIGAVCII